MPGDQIDVLSALHDKKLTEQIDAAFLAWLATINVDQLAGALDDTDDYHIRDQLILILDMNDDGTPQALDEGFQHSAPMLASFIAAVAALAAAQARHTLSASSSALAEVQQAARAFLDRYRADTAAGIFRAIDDALNGLGNAQARAAQLKRTIGLTSRQAACLNVLHTALQRFLATPRTLTPARIGGDGVRIPPIYTRQADTRSIFAATRGKISAAQGRILGGALANPKLTQADADLILDRHAAAMRRFRSRTAAAEGIHQFTETAKLTGWRIAQTFGALPADQRRHWITAGDERVRHSHAEVPEMNLGGVLLDQPFETPFGKRMNAPLEWGCRCRASLGNSR